MAETENWTPSNILVSYDSQRDWIVYSNMQTGVPIKIWDVNADAEVKAPYPLEFLRTMAEQIAKCRDFEFPTTLVPLHRRLLNRLTYWLRRWW